MLYIYDARYNIKKETTWEKLEGITGSKKATLMTIKSKGNKISRLDHCYIVDENTPQRQLWQWYDKVKLENETWKAIDEKYIISNYGRVKNMSFKKHPDGKFVYPHVKKDYGRNIPCVWLHKKECRLKSLVAKYFVENPHNYKYVKNKNGISYDLYHENLEYCSQSEILSIAAKTRFYDKKCIIAYDMDGNEIDTFDNASKAGRELFISRQTVLNNLHGKTKSACGMYKFRWEE